MTELAPQESLVQASHRRAAAASGRQVAAGLCAVFLVVACAPTVKVEAPKDPITINLNIQADVRVTLEEKAREVIEANPDVF